MADIHISHSLTINLDVLVYTHKESVDTFTISKNRSSDWPLGTYPIKQLPDFLKGIDYD